MTPIASLNVPHFKQEFPFSCLAACARMILAFYGVLHTEEEIRRQLGTGPHGTPARSLFLLQSLGFEVRIEESKLKELEDSLAAGIPPLSTGFLPACWPRGALRDALYNAAIQRFHCRNGLTNHNLARH